jgi:anti-sigma factor RsiW
MNDSNCCERVRERLPMYVDGELSELDEALDRGHMECCVGCGKERDGLLEFMLAARSAMQPDPEELKLELAALAPRISAAKLRPVALRLLTKRATMSFLTAAAAVLLLMLFDGEEGGLSRLGNGDLFDSLGIADWRLPLGDGSWSAKQ